MGCSPACRVISHCFVKIAASDDGNFILPLHDTEANEGRSEWGGGGVVKEGGIGRKRSKGKRLQ